MRGRAGGRRDGGGTPIDEANRKRLRAWGKVVYLRASAATLAVRLGEEGIARRPLLAGAPVVERLGEILGARAPLYEEADFVVDTNRRTPPEVVERIVRWLGEE